MSHEAELPGMEITREHLQIIYSRYYFASQFVEGKQVLEVGCGPGLGLGYLLRTAERAIGGDYAEDNLRLARSHYQSKTDLVIMDAHNLPFRDDCLDVVVSMATVIYLQLDRFFTECSRILKSSGMLVFCIPNKDQPGFRESPLSRNYYSVPELSQLLNPYFDAEFFGAFPVERSSKRLVAGGKNSLVALSGRMLDKMPKGEKIKTFISRYILRSRILRLTEEIEDGIIENIEPVPITGNSVNSDYKIIYVLARVK